MAFRQPWDVKCPRCKAAKGKVCRAAYTNTSCGEFAHVERWTKSLIGYNPLRKETDDATR